jgi:hypothetical protein
VYKNDSISQVIDSVIEFVIRNGNYTSAVIRDGRDSIF